MESQSFQDEYAEEASAERKALENEEKPSKRGNNGDLGGTNGTVSLSEKKSITTSSQDIPKEKEINQDEVKKAVWPW
jgi:hypothetical protein